MASLLLTPGKGFRYKMCPKLTLQEVLAIFGNPFLAISQKLLGGVFLLLAGMYIFNENFLDEDSL